VVGLFVKLMFLVKLGWPREARAISEKKFNRQFIAIRTSEEARAHADVTTDAM
jgi:hypothetical protein